MGGGALRAGSDMESEDARPRPEANMDGRKRFLRRRLAITFGAIPLISLAGAWFYLESLPPRDLGLLAAGRVCLRRPPLTRYWLSERGPTGTVEATVGMSGTGPPYLRWTG